MEIDESYPQPICHFDIIDRDTYSVIHSYFQIEELLVIGLVCKKWKLLFTTNSNIELNGVAKYYAFNGQLTVLQWLK